MPTAIRMVWTACCLALAAPGCAALSCDSEVPVQMRPRLEVTLVERIREAPDSVVGVLVRTSTPPTERERAALAGAGLRVGTVAGDIVTGRLRACDAVRVAELEFVRRIELARDVPPVPAPPR